MEDNGKKIIATEDELKEVSGGKDFSYLKNECKICGAVFHNSKELKAHQRAKHPNDPRIQW